MHNIFLSETYDKPKLVESKLVKKLIENKNNQETFESKLTNTIKNNIISFIKNNYRIIIIFVIIIIALYWRYKYAQKKKQQYIDSLENTDTIVDTDTIESTDTEN